MSDFDDQPALNDQLILSLMASETPPIELSIVDTKRLQQRIMAGLEQPKHAFHTIYSNEGVWVDIAPKLKKKVLYIDPNTQVESYLLRLAPGVKIQSHEHLGDEACLVLEGEITVDGLCLRAGDYHLAKAGSQHQSIYSAMGAIVFLQHSANHFTA